MCRIAILFLLAVSAFVASDAKHLRAAGVRLGQYPAVVLKLHRKALDSVFDGASTLIHTHAKKIPIPDVKATVSGVDIATRDTLIKDFEKPVIQYTLSAPNKITGSVEFPHVSIEGPFNATRRTLIKTQYDNGLLCFSAKAIQVTFKATIGETDNGAPQLQNFECEAKLGPANLNIKNNREKFPIEVMGLAAKTIRPVYQASVCPTAKDLVSNHLNRFLGKFPNVLEVNSELAYKLQLRPQVEPEFVQIAFHGKILTDQVSPYSPEKFEVTPTNDAFVVLLVSDALFNDFTYQAYANGKLGITINKDSHPLLYGLVSLECDDNLNDTCLGKVIPSLTAKYGQVADVQVTVKAIKAPVVEFKKDKATFSGAASADLSITNSSGTYHEATATFDLTGSLQVKIHENAIISRIRVEDVQVQILQPNQKQYEEKIKDTIKKVVEESINGGLLLKGIPLNLPFGLGVNDPLIKFAPHTLQAHTGFEYKARTSSESRESRRN